MKLCLVIINLSFLFWECCDLWNSPSCEGVLFRSKIRGLIELDSTDADLNPVEVHGLTNEVPGVLELD